MYCLEIAITDFCNLRCLYCSQGTPHQKGKRTMSREEIWAVASCIEPYEFDIIKLSGGEPTLHPQFREICRGLAEHFPADKYVLATNGCRLARYLDCIGVFTDIELSLYPSANDDVYMSLVAMDIPNLRPYMKRRDQELINVFRRPNTNKHQIAQRCRLREVKKVVQSRIYDCCVAFGVSVWSEVAPRSPRCLNPHLASVPVGPNWRQELAGVDLEPFCQQCFIDVDAPFPWEG